jgi:hypothetical protein
MALLMEIAFLIEALVFEKKATVLTPQRSRVCAMGREGKGIEPSARIVWAKAVVRCFLEG